MKNEINTTTKSQVSRILLVATVNAVMPYGINRAKLESSIALTSDEFHNAFLMAEAAMHYLYQEEGEVAYQQLLTTEIEEYNKLDEQGRAYMRAFDAIGRAVEACHARRFFSGMSVEELKSSYDKLTGEETHTGPTEVIEETHTGPVEVFDDEELPF